MCIRDRLLVDVCYISESRLASPALLARDREKRAVQKADGTQCFLQARGHVIFEFFKLAFFDYLQNKQLFLLVYLFS